TASCRGLPSRFTVPVTLVVGPPPEQAGRQTTDARSREKSRGRVIVSQGVVREERLTGEPPAATEEEGAGAAGWMPSEKGGASDLAPPRAQAVLRRNQERLRRRPPCPWP